eukprot:8094351-Alexandrium_andersonii.AAC.1
MSASLVGSEMCIRDRLYIVEVSSVYNCWNLQVGVGAPGRQGKVPRTLHGVKFELDHLGGVSPG